MQKKQLTVISPLTESEVSGEPTQDVIVAQQKALITVLMTEFLVSG